MKCEIKELKMEQLEGDVNALTQINQMLGNTLDALHVRLDQMTHENQMLQDAVRTRDLEIKKLQKQG